MSQRASKDLRQLDLGLKPAMTGLPEEIISKPATWRKSILMTADIAGLTDSQAADAMGVAQEMWSRLKTDPRTGVNPDRLEAFMDNCGNELLLHNLAWRRGYWLMQRETETQRLLRIEREAREKAEAENKLLRDLLTGRAA